MKFYRLRRNERLLTSNPICEVCADKKIEVHKYQPGVTLDVHEEPGVTSGQCICCGTYYEKPTHRSSVTIHYKGADERHPF